MKARSFSVLLFSILALLATGAGCGGDDSVSPTKETPPAAPGTLTVTPGDHQLTVTWSAVSGATSYEVYYHTEDNSAAATRFTGDPDETDTICVITGLNNGTPYHVWVKARNSGGNSGFSGGASETPEEPVAPPAAPGTPSLAPGDRQLTVTWSAVAGAARYEVYYNTANSSSSASTFTGDANDTDTSCIITGLVNGTLYYVWVKAFNGGGASDFSASASETPQSPGSSECFAGTYSSGRMIPCYWQGTTRIELDPQGQLTHNAMALSPVVVSSGTTYIAGAYTNDSNVKVACYWARASEGTVMRVDLGGDGTHNAFATAVAVEGSTVYASGYYNDGSKDIPCVWIGGARTDLGQYPLWGGRAMAVAVVGGVVYVGGYHYATRPQGLEIQMPCYWVDGVRTDLPGYDDTDSAGNPGFDGFNDYDAYVWSIAVDGGQIYTAGMVNNGSKFIACYWRGAARTDLSNAEPNGNATCIAVSGGVVYTGGYYESARLVPCYWTGGSRTELSTYSPTNDGRVYAITVKDGTVYAGGVSMGTSYWLACFWAGATRTDLPQVGFYGSVQTSFSLFSSSW